MNKRFKKRPGKKKNPGLILFLSFTAIVAAILAFNLYNAQPQTALILPRQAVVSKSIVKTPTQESKPVVTITEDSPVITPAPEKTEPTPTKTFKLEPEISRIKTEQSKIALTFDAGASASPTPSILKTLQDNNLQVTFFLTGKWCRQNPKLTKEIVENGNEIGNHTYSHKDLTKLNETDISDELTNMEDALYDAAGVYSSKLFRAPYGSRDKRVLEAIEADGYTSIYWSLDSWDAWKKDITGEEIKQRIIDKIKPGDIILLHCGSQPTAEILPEIIKELQQKGFEIVKVSELINENTDN